MRNKKFVDDQGTNIRSKKLIMMDQSRSFPRDESGAVMVLTALLLVALLGFAALAIDIGHLMVVKNELQNAADAGSLAGAANLAPFTTIDPPTPDWASAQTAAAGATRANRTDNTLITDCQVQVGYFNLINRELHSSAIAPTSADVPAVRVTVSRVAGQNTGPMLTFVAGTLGINLVDVSVQATAMISCPSTAPPKSIFPVAINLEFVKTWFKTNDPNDPGFSEQFDIGSDYHYPEGLAGQWTSFFDAKNDVPTIRDLIYNGNPDSVRINQMIQCLSDIYVQPGSKTSLYSDVKTKVGQTVFVPVVPAGFDTHAWNPVICYLPIKIMDAVGANKKVIKAKFAKKAMFRSNDVGGPCYGGYTPPRMVN